MCVQQTARRRREPHAPRLQWREGAAIRQRAAPSFDDAGAVPDANAIIGAHDRMA
jgi:hypothetical protein